MWNTDRLGSYIRAGWRRGADLHSGGGRGRIEREMDGQDAGVSQREGSEG
jgi:hypothetical protein